MNREQWIHVFALGLGPWKLIVLESAPFCSLVKECLCPGSAGASASEDFVHSWYDLEWSVSKVIRFVNNWTGKCGLLCFWCANLISDEWLERLRCESSPPLMLSVWPVTKYHNVWNDTCMYMIDPIEQVLALEQDNVLQNLHLLMSFPGIVCWYPLWTGTINCKMAITKKTNRNWGGWFQCSRDGLVFMVLWNEFDTYEAMVRINFASTLCQAWIDWNCGVASGEDGTWNDFGKDNILD